VKVATALSEVINLEKLLKRIVHVILEDTGAERGFLILNDDNGQPKVMERGTSRLFLSLLSPSLSVFSLSL
jgi:hypothetical protein